MTGPSTIEEYLADLPEDVRAALEQVRRTIKAAAPDTTETISYQMPTFKYRGRASWDSRRSRITAACFRTAGR